VIEVLALEGIGDDGLILNAHQIRQPRAAERANGPLELPRRRVGGGNGICHEMLSLRIVVEPGASASFSPARSHKRSMLSRTRVGSTRKTATLDFMAALLLPDRSR
jgi:hypothetical protein